MASEAVAILGEIRTALAAVSGLSTERVRRGTWQAVEAVAGGATLWIAAGPLSSDYGDDLCSYRRLLTVQCVIAAEASAADFGAREDAVLSLLDLCLAAVEGSTALRLLLRAAPRTLASGLLAVEGLGAPAAAFTIECAYGVDIGEGA